MNVFNQENEKKCPYCNELIIGNRGQYSNHVRWCKKNPKYNEILERSKNKISEGIKKYFLNKNGENKEFSVIEPEYKFPLKKYYYCSSECHHAHNKFIDDIGNKISKGFENKSEKYLIYYRQRYNKEYIEKKIDKICPVCGKKFKSKKICCSDKCARKYKLYKKIPDILKEENNINEIKKIYKRYCSFRFAIKSYPEEFDFTLIEKFGWYKAKNHGNNLNGISRDHKYSCDEGFKNLIDPYIISHPANCQLLKHNDNISKYNKCSITLEELKESIKEWNNKYGEYENKIDYVLFNKLNIKFNT